MTFIKKNLSFGGRYLLDIFDELDRYSSTIIINNLSEKQLKFLRKNCGLSVKKISNSVLLSISKRKEVDEIDLKKYLET